MKKPFIFLVLLCSSFLTTSQMMVGSKKLPYQVLFSEKAFIDNREIEQFEYLSDHSVIDVEGQITLFHQNGRLFELEKGSYRIKRLVIYESGKHTKRPVLNPRGKYRKPKKPWAPRATDRHLGVIEIIAPDDFENNFLWTDPVKLVWVLNDHDEYSKQQVFEVRFSNIYDETIREVESPNFSLEFLSDTLDNNRNEKPNISEGLLIVSINRKGDESYSSAEFGIKLIDKVENPEAAREDSNYFFLRLALYYDYIKKNMWADAYYQKSIIMSKKDHRLVKLYEDFLERNPQFK